MNPENQNPFKVGDVVRPKSSEANEVGRLVGYSVTGNYVVTEVNTFSVVLHPEQDTLSSHVVNISRLMPPTRRTEGEKIKPEDIKIGDTIRVSKVSGKMTMIHEAVVGDIKRQTDTKNYGTLLFYTERFTHTAQRINWGKDADETFVLLKAAPERDKLLDRLVGAKTGQVITFREVLARKCSDDRWEAIYNGGVAPLFTGNLRTQIGSSEVVWLKAES